nr:MULTISPECIES: flavin reductase family protein [unclassified Gluconobacter]
MHVSDDHFYTYRPEDGHGLLHDPFNAIIAPRPIGWIATVDEQGASNLAPYSFFNAFNYTPPIIGFSSIGWKDTVRNAKKTGEFVWNLVTQSLVDRMNLSSAAFEQEIDEFEVARLEKTPSCHVRPPRVAASPVQFECRVTQVVQLEASSGDCLETWLTLGEVVEIHIDRSPVRDGIYDTAAARPVLRAGGPGWYSEVTEGSMFDLRRPSSSEAALAEGIGLPVLPPKP